MSNQFHPTLVLLKAPDGMGNSLSIEGRTVLIDDDGYVEVPRDMVATLSSHGLVECPNGRAAKK